MRGAHRILAAALGALLAFLPVVALAQTTPLYSATGTLAGAGATVNLVSLAAPASCSTLLTGTFTESIALQGSSDPAASVNNTWTTIANYTAVGNSVTNCSGYAYLRLVVTSYTSGSATAILTSTSAGTPPLLSVCGLSAPVSAVSTTTQVIPLATGSAIRVCGFFLSNAGTGSTTITLSYGTGANCGTGNVAPAGTFAVVPSALSPVLSYTPIFVVPASNALCVAGGGTAPSVSGLILYAQQ
jgi:hypothetical protein